MDNLRLAGKRVIVTGASRSIGRAIAVGFARNGAHVSICGRDEKALETTRAACAELGVRVHSEICDVSDGAAFERYIGSAAEALGGLNVLVSNASAFARGEDDPAWATAFETDLMSVVRGTRAALPWLKQAQEAAVVHISSISALKPTPRAIAYGSLKAAINQLTKSQAWVLAKDRIRVNAVAPGSITGPGHMWEKRRESGDPAYAEAVAKIPFGRLGDVDEIADVTLFLASPMSRWVTGQIVVVDGGQMLKP
ncbi:SDR family NAD(P)-dependent oxidoreductase [Terricaulis silvestris]|uniref:D-xylose 1-dehydrogenase n=1 Tax=Terricaulis silvestris TaxID=2686094 RepID=A0A6I6MIR9_9CAUL|nr:SDR family NAD(P)-dependent oxidoreductase [Terricaulis silvestris]QGZ93671.1 General stress protein 39 [Terricaulis silvestris]